MTIDYEQDAGVNRGQEVLAEITRLVEARNAAAATLEAREAEVKSAKAQLDKIEREDLPELMRSAGLKKITALDGTIVDVTDELSCAITQANKDAAHTWLRDKGYGSVIKTEVSVPFGKDQIAEADALFLELAARFPEAGVERAEAIHPTTLKALLKELRTNGVPIPTEPVNLFSLLPYSIAKCKLPRDKGSKL